MVKRVVGTSGVSNTTLATIDGWTTPGSGGTLQDPPSGSSVRSTIVATKRGVGTNSRKLPALNLADTSSNSATASACSGCSSGSDAELVSGSHVEGAHDSGFYTDRLRSLSTTSVNSGNILSNDEISSIMDNNSFTQDPFSGSKTVPSSATSTSHPTQEIRISKSLKSRIRERSKGRQRSSTATEDGMNSYLSSSSVNNSANTTPSANSLLRHPLGLGTPVKLSSVSPSTPLSTTATDLSSSMRREGSSRRPSLGVASIHSTPHKTLTSLNAASISPIVTSVPNDSTDDEPSAAMFHHFSLPRSLGGSSGSNSGSIRLQKLVDSASLSGSKESSGNVFFNGGSTPVIDRAKENDTIIQMRLQEAKSLARREGDDGAVMHQFALWQKPRDIYSDTAAATPSTSASDHQSIPTVPVPASLVTLLGSRNTGHEGSEWDEEEGTDHYSDDQSSTGYSDEGFATPDEDDVSHTQSSAPNTPPPRDTPCSSTLSSTPEDVTTTHGGVTHLGVKTSQASLRSKIVDAQRIDHEVTTARRADTDISGQAATLTYEEDEITPFRRSHSVSLLDNSRDMDTHTLLSTSGPMTFSSISKPNDDTSNNESISAKEKLSLSMGEDVLGGKDTNINTNESSEYNSTSLMNSQPRHSEKRDSHLPRPRPSIIRGLRVAKKEAEVNNCSIPKPRRPLKHLSPVRNGQTTPVVALTSVAIMDGISGIAPYASSERASLQITATEVLAKASLTDANPFGVAGAKPWDPEKDRLSAHGIDLPADEIVSAWNGDITAPPQPAGSMHGQTENAEVGAVLRWRTGELIGEGSFGRVYKGMNEATGELLAIKQLCLADGSEKEAEALRREIEVMWSLSHDNIVRYLGASRTSRYLFIVLEYVTGGSLAGMLRQFGAISESLLRRFSGQILCGVEYLHNMNIIHRDIKGANILVSDQGVAKLADFGCSKRMAGLMSGSLDESMFAVRGSIPWMAPEVIKQAGHGRPSDIWSFGATVIEMATGHPPWREYTSSLAALFAVATSTTPPPTPPNLSPLASAFLERCLVISPEGRATAAELLHDEFLRPDSQANTM